jgi:hypothetical protein
MATYKADTVYSYRKGGGGTASGSNVRTLFTVNGKTESAVLAEVKKRHGQFAEVVIHRIEWK